MYPQCISINRHGYLGSDEHQQTMFIVFFTVSLEDCTRRQRYALLDRKAYVLVAPRVTVICREENFAPWHHWDSLLLSQEDRAHVSGD